jgi:RNA polymerase sigma-B factor
MGNFTDSNGTRHRSVAEQERADRTRALLQTASIAGEPQRGELLNTVVLLNRSVADAVANRFAERGVDAEDLTQVAYLALVKAVRRFDPDHGHDFLSFAVPTIRGEIRRYFRDLCWTIRPTRRLQDLHTELLSLRPAMTQQLGRRPSSAQLADRLDVPRRAIDEVQAIDDAGYYSPLSLDVGGDHGDPMQGQLSQTLGTEDPELSRVEARVTVLPLLAALRPRERLILKLRFRDGLTQQRIGEHIGITQMQVSRILQAILADLRARLEAA